MSSDHRLTENPIPGPPEAPAEDDEEVLWSSQSEHYHCTPQGIRILGGTEEEQEQMQEWYEEGLLECPPVQVTVRNRHGVPLRVQHQWDGFQLHLDACPTRETTLPPGEALRATGRWARARWQWLLVLTLAFLGTLLAGAWAAGLPP